MANTVTQPNRNHCVVVVGRGYVFECTKGFQYCHCREELNTLVDEEGIGALEIETKGGEKEVESNIKKGLRKCASN